MEGWKVRGEARIREYASICHIYRVYQVGRVSFLPRIISLKFRILFLFPFSTKISSYRYSHGIKNIRSKKLMGFFLNLKSNRKLIYLMEVYILVLLLFNAK